MHLGNHFKLTDAEISQFFISQVGYSVTETGSNGYLSSIFSRIYILKIKN